MFLKIYVFIFMLISATATRYKNCWPYGSLLRHENDQGPLEYCTTKERPPQIVLLGDKIETRDCHLCTCTSDGLYCCGICEMNTTSLCNGRRTCRERVVKLVDCATTSNLGLKSIGIHEFTGSIDVPDGCQLVVRGCNYSFVQKQNSYTPCS